MIAVLAAVATGIVVPILVDTFAKTLDRLPLVFAAVGIAG